MHLGSIVPGKGQQLQKGAPALMGVTSWTVLEAGTLPTGTLAETGHLLDRLGTSQSRRVGYLTVCSVHHRLVMGGALLLTEGALTVH